MSSSGVDVRHAILDHMCKNPLLNASLDEVYHHLEEYQFQPAEIAGFLDELEDEGDGAISVEGGYILIDSDAHKNLKTPAEKLALEFFFERRNSFQTMGNAKQALKPKGFDEAAKAAVQNLARHEYLEQHGTHYMITLAGIVQHINELRG